MPPSEQTYAQCRSLGHEWRHMPQAERHAWGIVLRSKCADCGTVRTKELERAGKLGRTRYEYPDGYSRHGDEKLPLHEWRSLYVVQFMKAPRKRKAS